MMQSMDGCRMEFNMKRKNKRVIPGFGLSMGVTIAMLSCVVLIPLATLVIYSSSLGIRQFLK